MAHGIADRGFAATAVAGATLWLVCAFIVTTTSSHAGAAGEEIVATVNGEPITAAEVDQRRKFDQLAKHRELSRQEVVDELIDEKRKLGAAQRNGIEVTDLDVETAYANMAKRMHLSAEQLTGALAHAGVDAGTLKRRIRADIAWQQIVRAGIAIPNDVPSLREQQDIAPFSKGVNEGPPGRKKEDGPSWRE
jgi:SurA-like N-terminal domain